MSVFIFARGHRLSRRSHRVQLLWAITLRTLSPKWFLRIILPLSGGITAIIINLPCFPGISRYAGPQEIDLVWICQMFAQFFLSSFFIFYLIFIFSPLFSSSFYLSPCPLPSMTFKNRRNPANPSNKDFFPHNNFILSFKKNYKMQSTTTHEKATKPRKCHPSAPRAIVGSFQRRSVQSLSTHAHTHTHRLGSQTKWMKGAIIWLILFNGQITVIRVSTFLEVHRAGPLLKSSWAYSEP